MDARSDVFSLGAILYEMLCGQPPFEGATASDVLVGILDRAPVALRERRAAARAFFPRGEAVGRRIHLGPDPSAPWSVVVGVVGDVREEGLDRPPSPAVCPSHRQNTWWRSLAIAVRTPGDPLAAEPLLRQAVREADPTVALRSVRTLEEVLGSNLAARRFALGLVASFAGVALALAAVGIYGVLAFSVAGRTREFGVRLALGASRSTVLLLVLRQGMAWSLLGLLLGIAGAMAGGRLLEGMLDGVTPADGQTLGTVIIIFLGVVSFACVVLAARAMRVDPAASMRAE